MVKVKVRGVVENGERIYASINSYPGMAMPEHVIKQVTSQDLTLIGQSLETVNNVSPDGVSLVSCFVSILLSIQTQHTTKALSDMRVDVLGNVDKKIFTAKRIIVRGEIEVSVIDLWVATRSSYSPVHLVVFSCLKLEG